MHQEMNENEPLLINSNHSYYDDTNTNNTNDDDEENDNNNNEQTTKSLDILSVIFLTVNATLGAGLLNIPYSFNNCGGILIAIIIQIIHVLLIILSLIIISIITNLSKVNSLQMLIEYYCGKSWSNLCSLSIFIYSYGACITYLIVIGDQFEKILEFYYGIDYSNYWYLHRNFFIITISLLTILPLCLSKDISFLRFASFIGFLSTFYLTILVLLEFIKLPSKNDENIIIIKPSNWNDIFKILPVLTFSYQCHTSWIPTIAETKKPTLPRLIIMIILSVLICFISYSWTAIFGLLTFGSDHIQKDMMQNYDPRDPFVAIGMVLLIIKTIVVYPVLLYCGRIVIEQLFSNQLSTSTTNNEQNEQNKSIETKIRICSSIIWILTSSILAIYIPNIGVAINYLGSLANLFVFILPGLCLYMIILNEQKFHLIRNEYKLMANKYLLLVISTLFISYGIGVFAYSIILSILDLLDHHEQHI